MKIHRADDTAVHETTPAGAPRETSVDTLIAQLRMQRDDERGQAVVQPDELPVEVIHLLVADDGLDEQFQCGVYVAMCGGLVPRWDLPAGQCPEGCECNLELYCPECVSRAAELSAKARPGPSAQEHDSRDESPAIYDPSNYA
jgi:hypothetical protein